MSSAKIASPVRRHSPSEPYKSGVTPRRFSVRAIFKNSFHFSSFILDTPYVFVCPPENKKIFRHEQHKPPNARFGSFAIHAEDFASVIIFIFRLIRQMRANGRIACLRVYCTIRAGFVNAFLHAPTLDIFSPSGV